MISVLKKRIIFVGDHRNWSSKWFDMDDRSFDHLGRKEIQSIRNEYDRELSVKKIDKFTRVIDDSEYVVRCSKFRTSYPGGYSSGANHNSYGMKTDVVVSTPIVFSNIFSMRRMENMSAGDEIHGFKSSNEKFKKDYSLMDNQQKEFYRLHGNSICTKHNNPEIWIPISRQLNQLAIIMFGSTFKDWNRISDDWLLPVMRNNKIRSFKDFNTFAKDFFKKASNTISKYTEYWSSNIKILDFKKVLELRDEIDSYWLPFTELNRRFKNAKWWNETLNRRVNEPSIKNIGYEESVSASRTTLRMNRGIEAIGLAMNDTRFKDYDIYIIGYFGLEQEFCHHPHNNSMIPGYRMLTDWIHKGKVKYLPEHIDLLAKHHHCNVSQNSIPIDINIK